MASICIFCGANEGILPVYRESAIKLAEALVSEKITLVYGGGNVGLMGIISDHALQIGGRVIGVMPEALMDREIAHTNLTEMHVVKDMHDRKKLLSQLSDAFIALPGGIGTMDELFQEMALQQINYHNKTCGLLNTENYYDHLMSFLKHSDAQGFIRHTWQDDLIIDADPANLVFKIQATIQ